MLKNPPFYFSITKKLVAAFGTIFNEIVMERFDANNQVTEAIQVPISYAPKEKVLARLKGDPAIDHKAAITLPRISFELTSLEYDSARKLNATQIMRPVEQSDGGYSKQFVPTPWNFHFSLWVYAKSIEDGLPIVEQIYPFFQPELPLKVEFIPGIETNVPVILNSVQMEDTYEGNFTDEERKILWTFDFTVKACYFGPIRNAAIIKFVDVSFFTSNNSNTPLSSVTVQPGLTANGEPTTDINLTVPYQQISANDNYGIITQIFDF
jgi:hypothetical protein